MMIEAILFALALVALVASSFCSGVESGFLSVNKNRIIHLVREGSRRAKMLHDCLADMSSAMTTILIGNNIANVVFSSCSAALACRYFPESDLAQVVWSFIAATIVLYVSEFLPKMFFTSRPLSRMLSVAVVFRLFIKALSPLASVAVWFTDLFLPRNYAATKHNENDLLRILQDRKDGVRLTDIESALISRIIVLRKKGANITQESLLSVIDDEP